MSRDETIAVQRQIIAEMNLTVHKDRLLTDHVMVDKTTGRPLNRGQLFDLHAIHAVVLDERGAL